MLVLLLNDTAARSRNPGCQLTSRTFHRQLDLPDAARKSLEWGFARRLRLDDRKLWKELLAGHWLAEPVLRHLAAVEYGPEAIQDCLNADLIVFQPEGTVSDNENALRILRFLSLPLWVALHGKAPVAVANGTFPLLEDHRAALIRILLDHADLALMRDRVSARHWGAGCAPDSAVLWQGAGREAAPQWLLITTAAECPVETDLAIGRAGLAAARRLGLRPLILGKAWQNLVPLRPEIESLGGEILESTLLDEVDQRIAGCRLHLGGRYHMALLCATKGIPSALIRTNTHKNLWLAEEFSGIRMASTPKDLAATAETLGDCPPEGILADVARLGQEATVALSALRHLERGTRPSFPTLSDDLLRHLNHQARADRWRQRLRSLRIG